jgi:mono/diheme cytochrome c family protein
VREGIGGWSQDTIVGYLKTGIAPGHALVAGPMTDVIHESLRFLTDQDLAAIASYLKATPAKELYAETHLNLPDGAAEYLNHCGFCHQPDGKGLTGAIPPLAGDGTVLAGGPEDVIRTILGGRAARATYSAMPGFATILTGPQIADITNYVRTSWGNGAPANATVPIVEDLTKTTATMLSGTAKCDPVGPPAVASAIASSGADAALHQINQANMLEQVDAFLPKMMSAGKNLAPADVVNGLTAAYCPIIMGNADFTPRQRLLELQQFAILVYSQLRGSPNSQALNIPVVPAKN